MMIEMPYKELLCLILVIQCKSVVHEGIPEMVREDEVVTVLVGVGLVNAVETVDRERLQPVAAGCIAQTIIGRLDLPGPLHHRSTVEETQASSSHRPKGSAAA